MDAGVCDAQDAGIVHTGKEENGHATIRSDTGDGTSVENPTGGVTTFNALADVKNEFGEGFVFIKGSTLDTYAYPKRGIEFWVNPDGRVNSFYVYAPTP